MEDVKNYVIFGLRYYYNFNLDLVIKHNRLNITNLELGFFGYFNVDLDRDLKSLTLGPKLEIDFEIYNVDLFIDIVYAIHIDKKISFCKVFGLNFKIKFE